MLSRKAYVLAAIGIIGVILLFVSIHFISEYGPTSTRAELKSRVEYVMTSFGSKNKSSKTWSTYKQNEADLQLDYDPEIYCKYFELQMHGETEENRQELLKNTEFYIDDVTIKDDTAIVTIQFKGKKSTEYTSASIFFTKEYGSWTIMESSVELIFYIGNNVLSGTSTYDLLNSLSSF